MPSEQLSITEHHDTEPVVVPPETAREVGHVATLFRVMNLDDHSGIVERGDSGKIIYTVDNQQYPDQGDFAFSGPNGFDNATTRAFPNHLSNVHAVRAQEKDIVTPYPEEAPDLVYIRNGATVEAVPVPSDIIDKHVDAVYSGKDGIQDARSEIDALFADTPSHK